MRSALCLVFIVVFPLFLVGSVKLLERMISALCLVLMFPCFLFGWQCRIVKTLEELRG